ncbi:MAG: hypothetical protein K2Q32_05985, partial [Alphaproteobacteria bacterium]|nr:hypothetical protein [Alphaproteobacteria bacterium]
MTKLMTPQISPTGKPQELFRTPIRHVVIIKTTTRQKTEQYAAAARYYGLPILFMDLSDIQDGFVVVDEDTNSRVDNAIKKAVDHDNVDAQLRDPTSALSKILRNRLSEYGIDYDGVKIHRAVEDSTMTTDLPEWKILHNLLSPYVPESMLHGIAKNGTQAGPAAETGKVMSSSTLHYLMEGTRRSHLRLKRRELGKTKGDKAQKPIVSSPNITSVTTFILSTLDADMTPEKIFTGETQYKIIIPDGLENPIPKPAARISESEDYYARPDNLRMAENSHHLEWLLKRSPRGKIVRQIAEHLGIPVPEIDVGQLFSVSASTTFIRRKWPMKNPEIVSFGAGDDRIGRFRIKLHVPETITPEALNIEGLLEKTDAMIFRGIGDLSDDQKTLYRLHYYAALVDRQTRARAKHRPMIVVDDGSLSTLIDFGIKLYDKGFVKNYLNRPVYQGKSAIVSDPDIDHFSDGYMDVIRSNTGKPLTPLQERAAINQILEFRLASYVPFVAPTPEPTMPKVGGAAIHPDDVTVTFYTSATND